MPGNFNYPQVNYDYSGITALGNGLVKGLQDRQLQNELANFNGDFNAAAERLMRMGRVDDAVKLYTAGALANYRKQMAGVATQKVQQSPMSLAQKWLDLNGGGTAPPEGLPAPQPVAPESPPAPDLGMAPEATPPMELGPSDNTQLAQAAPIPPGPNGPTGQYGSTYATPSGVNPKLVNAPGPIQEALMPKQALTQLNDQAALNVKRQAQKPTDWALVQSADAKLQNMSNNIDSLLTPTGEAGAGLKRITGTHQVEGINTRIPNAFLPNVSLTAMDASAKLKTAVIEVGLNALAEMRAASAQGASGMGQLAIQESQWLQNSIANLQEAQSTPQIVANLKQVKQFSDLLRASLRQKYQMEHGEPWTPVSPDALNAVPKNVPGAMDMGAPLPGDKAIPGATQLTTNPGAYNPNAAYAASQDKLSKLMSLVSSGKVSRQAAAAAMKRDQYPDDVIQKVLGGQ